MYRFEHVIELRATPERIWRALTLPSEVVDWEGSVAAAVDAPADYPQPGQRVVWKLKSGPFRRLVDRPQMVQPQSLLRSKLNLGRIEMDETYSIKELDEGCELTLAVQVNLPVPVIGFALEQLYFGPKLEGESEMALLRLRLHCAAVA